MDEVSSEVSTSEEEEEEEEEGEKEEEEAIEEQRRRQRALLEKEKVCSRRGRLRESGGRGAVSVSLNVCTHAILDRKSVCGENMHNHNTGVLPLIPGPTQGNDLFREGKFEAAIEHYSSGMALDPRNAMLPANRAMALIKVERSAPPMTPPKTPPTLPLSMLSIGCNGCGCDLFVCSAVQCSAVQCSAVQCSAVQCCGVLCCAVLCCAVLCCAVLCCAVLC